MRQCRPLIIGAHHRNHTAAGIGGGLERLGIPLHQCGLNVIALRLAVQDLADGVAVMPEVGVEPNKALVAGFVDTGDGVPCRGRRLVIDAQITLAPAFDHGVAHVDADVLLFAAAQFPDFGGS